MKINLLSANEIIKKRGLQPGGKAQMYFADALLAYGDKRTPKQEGNLIKQAEIQKGGTEIYYPGPYARYLWFGFAMEGKPPMKPTDRPLQYQESTTRGKKWLEKTWTEDGSKILEEVAKEAGGRAK